jgi:hypothetical protein
MLSPNKLMELFQQHYEKVVLGLAIAALVASGLKLATKKQDEEAGLNNYIVDASRRKAFPYTNINWTAYNEALSKATNPVTLDFTKPRLHNLFGPVKWQRRPDGTLLKVEMGNEVGPDALKITRIAPLLLTVALDKVSGTNGFFISVTREAATNALLRRKLQSYLTLGAKDRLGTFMLREIKGTATEPELVIELADTGDRATVTKDTPFTRVDGYKADLSYPPENRTFAEKRPDESITIAGQDYNIIAISKNELVLSARSNNKRSTLRYNAAP